MYMLNGERLLELIKQLSCICEKTQIGNDVPHIDKTTITLKLHRGILERAIGNEVPDGETLEDFTRRVFKHHFDNHEKDVDLQVVEPTALSEAYIKAAQEAETGDDNDPTITLTSFSMPAIKALSKLLLYNKEVHVTDIVRKKATLDDKGEPEIKTYKSKMICDDSSVMRYPDVDIFHYNDSEFIKNATHGEISKDRPIEIDPDSSYLSFHYSLAAFYRNPDNAGKDFKTESKRLIENEMRQILRDHDRIESNPTPVVGSNMISHGYNLEIAEVQGADHEIKVCMEFFDGSLFKQAIQTLGLNDEYKASITKQQKQTPEENVKPDPLEI